MAGELDPIIARLRELLSKEDDPNQVMRYAVQLKFLLINRARINGDAASSTEGAANPDAEDERPV